MPDRGCSRGSSHFLKTGSSASLTKILSTFEDIPTICTPSKENVIVARRSKRSSCHATYTVLLLLLPLFFGLLIWKLWIEEAPVLLLKLITLPKLFPLSVLLVKRISHNGSSLTILGKQSFQN